MKKVVKGIDPPSIFEKIPIIRYDDTNACHEQQLAINKEKKKFNIPVGDVNNDDDYNKNVTPSFILPKYMSSTLKTNLSNIISNLSSKGLIL